MFIRPLVSRSLSQTPSQPQFNFTVRQLMGKRVNILSVLNDKLLVGPICIPCLFVMSSDGCHLSTIRIDYSDYYRLFDATWTPRGNILYSSYNNNEEEVGVISMSEKVIIGRTRMKSPHRFSVSSDNVIYLADWETGVYQSTDDGISWNEVFKPTDKRHCVEVIKVLSDHGEVFWCLESDSETFHLRVYSVDKKQDGTLNLSWVDISDFMTDGKPIDFSLNSCLSYDGDTNVFLSDFDNKAVHVFSMNGQYRCQLLSSEHITNWSYKLAVDVQNDVLYVGQSEGMVKGFELKYVAGV